MTGVLGYDLSPYSSWSHGELWLRTNFELAVGSADGGEKEFNFTMMNFIAGPEVKYYLFPRIDLFTSILAGISILGVSTPDNKVEVDEEEKDDSAGGASPSLQMAAGLDIILHPDWQIRAGAGYRFSFSEMKLEPPEDAAEKSLFDGEEVGSYSGLQIKAGLTYIF